MGLFVVLFFTNSRRRADVCFNEPCPIALDLTINLIYGAEVAVEKGGGGGGGLWGARALKEKEVPNQSGRHKTITELNTRDAPQ